MRGATTGVTADSKPRRLAWNDTAIPAKNEVKKAQLKSWALGFVTSSRFKLETS